MRFILEDTDQRTFRAERMCYLGSFDDWIDISMTGQLDRLSRESIPALGTDAFYELSLRRR